MFDELRGDIVARRGVVVQLAKVLNAVHAFAPVFRAQLDAIGSQAEYEAIAETIVTNAVVVEMGPGDEEADGPTEEYLGGEVPEAAADAANTDAAAAVDTAAADIAADAPANVPPRTFAQVCADAECKRGRAHAFRRSEQTSALLQSDALITDKLDAVCKMLSPTKAARRECKRKKRTAAQSTRRRRQQGARGTTSQSTSGSGRRRVRRAPRSCSTSASRASRCCRDGSAIHEFENNDLIFSGTLWYLFPFGVVGTSGPVMSWLRRHFFFHVSDVFEVDATFMHILLSQDFIALQSCLEIGGRFLGICLLFPLNASTSLPQPRRDSVQRRPAHRLRYRSSPRRGAARRRPGRAQRQRRSGRSKH